jgi:hypothetical protein
VVNALLRPLDLASDGAHVAGGVAQKIAELRTCFFRLNSACGEEKCETMRSAHALALFGSKTPTHAGSYAARIVLALS